MEPKHLDLDGLLRVSYGLGDACGCPECQAAVQRMVQQRRGSRGEDGLPDWFWLRQSRAIQDAAQVRSRPRWVSIAALAGVLAAAVLAIQPHPNKEPVRFSQEDERLFQEIGATVNRVEPRALAPMDLLWAQ